MHEYKKCLATAYEGKTLKVNLCKPTPFRRHVFPLIEQTAATIKQNCPL